MKLISNQILIKTSNKTKSFWVISIVILFFSMDVFSQKEDLCLKNAIEYLTTNKSIVKDLKGISPCFYKITKNDSLMYRISRYQPLVKLNKLVNDTNLINNLSESQEIIELYNAKSNKVSFVSRINYNYVSYSTDSSSRLVLYLQSPIKNTLYGEFLIQDRSEAPRDVSNLSVFVPNKKRLVFILIFDKSWNVIQMITSEIYYSSGFRERF